MLVYFKFKFQRQLRRSKRDLRLWKAWATNYYERNVWGKWRQLGIIRRFAFAWWVVTLLVMIGLTQQTMALDSFYLKKGPAPGGTYSEGLVGEVKNINPILPESGAASDVASLVFSGLTRYTPSRGIEGDLAESWTISDDGRAYTFKLKSGVKWHDGSPFTAQDVLFTLAVIQNPDTRSPLAVSWQGINVEAQDDSTVTFRLPSPYTPFIYYTTVGMLPSHLLGGVEASALRVASFNQAPVGTGPFKVVNFETGDNIIQLEANTDYYGGKPLLDQFVFRLFETSEEMLDAYAKKQITAIGRLKSRLEGNAQKLGKVKIYDLSLADESVLFMRNEHAVLKEANVRKAIASAINRQEVIDQGTAGDGVAIKLPLLPGQVGYTSKHQPPGFNANEATRLLEEAGWVQPERGPRTKDGSELKLRLVTADTGNFPQVAEVIKGQLAKVGVGTEVVIAEVMTLQQSYIRPRNFDLLLYGISIGADPDVYTYWHSSQAADPGLNLSQYKSAAADKALESARVSADERVRSVRYGNFLAAWAADVPAVVLYNPSYFYAVQPEVQGIAAKKIVNPSDRFYGIEKWTVKTQKTKKL